jgi:hypothetical protein
LVVPFVPVNVVPNIGMPDARNNPFVCIAA